MIRGTRQKLVAAASPVAPMPEWATSPISRHLIGLMEKYRPPTKPDLAVDYFRELDDYKPQSHPLHFWHTSHLPDGGWNHWTGKRNRVYWVPGSHETIDKPPLVSGLAQSMRQAMDRNLRLFARV
jgi:thioesterase domain-containing protein